MGIIANIIDLVNGARIGTKSLTKSDFEFRTTRNSISRKSSDSILQFPVICSDALTPDDLMMVSKALEREYSQFVRIAASLDDVIDVKGNNVRDAKLNKLRSIHQNMGYNGQGRFGMNGGQFYIESGDMTYTSICESFERKNIELLAPANPSLNESSLYQMTCKNNKNYYCLGEANDNEGVKDVKSDLEIKQLKANLSRGSAQEKRDEEKFKYQKDNDAAKMRYQVERDKRVEDFNREKFNYQKERDAKADALLRGTVISNRSPFQNQLLATDVKKANELIPTMMELNFLYDNGSQFVETSIIVGIKTVNHLVSSDEMMYNMSLAVKEKRHLFNFIQWTTGEIEMVKDWMLAKDKIKDEVNRQRAGKESTWWRRMRGRAAEDKLRRFTFNRKDVLPNSTLVLTMDEVEMIKNNYNIDILKDRRVLRAIFGTFFLLGFVIVDNASELVYFNFDGQSDFQIQSYRSLEKENSSAADMKSLISLVDKSGRR